MPLSSIGRFALALVASVTSLAAVCFVASCITAPPPDLPATTPHHPTAIHASTMPLEGILTEWPADDGFNVPVEVYDPNQDFHWGVFVDFHPPLVTHMYGSYPAANGTVHTSPALLDGGVVTVPFTLHVNDLASFGNPAGPCHTIQFLVANAFNDISQHTPDSLGSDSVVWIYQPDGAGPCDMSDASLSDEGPDDGSSDALLLVPDQVGPH
jgi:hypothetical protein